MKLFADFYHSDIIVASPLGLRMIIGTEGEKKRDYDFLSSIELLIVDQADVFHMQNLEHVYDIFEHLHQTPKESHDVDFSRVRMWCVNEWSRFYRQTLLFSSVQTPEMNSIFNRHCLNYAGKSRFVRASEDTGSIAQVGVHVPQTFLRIDATKHGEDADMRFQIFCDEVLPRFRKADSSHVAIYIPSYFDFVRVRNYLKKEAVNFAAISEYSKRAQISQMRAEFLKGSKTLLLFTERFYFFYRYRIRGIRQLIFYGLPLYPQFYPEIVNFMDVSDDSSAKSSATCSVIYSKFDTFKLTDIVNSVRSRQMITSTKSKHVIVTGE